MILFFQVRILKRKRKLKNQPTTATISKKDILFNVKLGKHSLKTKNSFLHTVNIWENAFYFSYFSMMDKKLYHANQQNAV